MDLSPEALMMISSGPVGMAIVGYWIKASIKRVESIPKILFELEHIKNKLTELSVELKIISEKREQNFVELAKLRQSLDRQWERVDRIGDKINV